MASPSYQYPTTINSPNPLLSKAHVTCLNLSHFKMVEAMGLEIIALKFNESRPSSSKVIHKSFIPENNNVFRSFCPTVKNMFIMVTSAKYDM
jgi:hypothetical protein